MTEFPDFSVLVGKTFKSVENLENREIHFTTIEGGKYKLYHEQDCCECVYVESVVGDLDDLVGTPILMAEEVFGETGGDAYEYFTWTFYKLATIKGYVDIRFYGSSNGYYSERVDFVKVA